MEKLIIKSTVDHEPKYDDVIRQGWLSAYSHIFGADKINQKFDNREKDKEYHDNQVNEIKTTDNYFSLMLNDELVGIMTVLDFDDYLEITRLYIHPSMQRQGFGTIAFEHAKQIAKNRGFNKIKLEALKDNHIGCAFYKKHGGKIVNTETKQLLGTTVELLTFEYDI